MLADARSLEDGSRIECDLCIVGGGAAGITLARELSGGRLRVCLLESGGLEADAASQELAAGRGLGAADDAYLTTTRLRYLGGSTNHWWGMCAPLEAHDFEHRPWVPHSGWPITRAELDPYYERAQPVCQLGPWDYDVDSWAKEPLLPKTPRTVRRMWQYSTPTRFGAFYLQELRESSNVQVQLHATAVELVAREAAGHVLRADVRTLAGGSFQVAARAFVLAGGGIENPRLLLASNGMAPAGLGNAHDLVGRFFMEHPHYPWAGGILLHGDGLERHAEKQRARGIRFRIHFGVNAETQRREGLLNGSYAIFDPRELEQEIEPALLAMLGDVTGRHATGEAGSASIFARNEQAPNPESRVSLGEERDALGMRRVVLDWRLGDLDLESTRRSLEILAEDLGAVGAARLRIDPRIDPTIEAGDLAGAEAPLGGAHHMGTTRMSDDPATGVVDRHCRVHGVENLWVAGSSVFPTVGWANPTLTIVALALRLAERLERELAA